MSAGTITLTNNWITVTGSGTTFTKDLKPGDLIVSVVGGVTYTLAVKSVDSDTKVMLLKAYEGPTQAGAAWYAVPRDAMNAITAQLAAETAKALRGLNLDKENWQQVFSGTGDVTVKLPDGSAFTGPAWNSFNSALNLKADKTDLDKKADKTEVDKKADKSSLGELASKSTISRSELNNELSRNLFASGARSKNDGGAGVWTFDNTPWGFDTQYGIAIQVNNRIDTSNAAGQGVWQHYLALGTNGEVLYVLNVNGEYAACKMWSTKNTTVDGNGFIKKASPIARLAGASDKMPDDYLDGFTLSGNVAVNSEAAGVSAERVSVGVYEVTGALGFAKEGWTIEVPQDVNGNRLCFVETSTDSNGVITVKVSKRRFDIDTAAIVAGEPIDIPDGRWIDLRLEMTESKNK